MTIKFRRTIWIIAILLVIASIVVDFYFGPRVVSIDNAEPTKEFILIDYFSSFITIIVLAIQISLLLSIIPYRKLNYKSKFYFFFPIGIIITCLLFIYTFTSAAYYQKKTGKALTPVKLYSSIEAKKNMNCESITDGTFKTKNLLIERKGNLQIQTDIKTGKKIELKVEWIGDCEYTLVGLQEDEVLKVKIVDITNEYYDYYSTFGSYAKRGRIWMHNKK